MLLAALRDTCGKKLMIRICLIRKSKWVESLVILRTDGWNFQRAISMSKEHYLLQPNHGHLELLLCRGVE